MFVVQSNTSESSRSMPTPAAGPGQAPASVSSAPSEASAGNSGLKFLIELAPLAVFFAVYAWSDLIKATGVLMVATVASLIAARYFLGKLSAMPLITAGFVLVFGGLTVWSANEAFIKIKPTVVYICLALPLLIGLLFGKSLLSHVLGEAVAMDESGWRQLTLRWGLFFLVLAALNEIVWRNFSTATWVSMKSFGFIPLTLIFAASQVPLMLRHKAQPQVGDQDRS
jgi:intracellular septation protein